MIKKVISYIEKYCNGVMEDVDKTDYYNGSKDVAESIRDVLEDLPDLFSVYCYSISTGEFIEIACTQTYVDCKHIAEAYSRMNNGEVRIRYEYKNEQVFEIKRVGTMYRHFKLGSVDV